MTTLEENRRAISQLAALSLDPTRTCKHCTKRTRAGNCGKPVEAGLSRAFGVYWPESNQWVQTKCRAFEKKGKAT